MASGRYKLTIQGTYESMSRLDVDGNFPQNVFSMEVQILADRSKFFHMYANVAPTGVADRWAGDVVKKTVSGLDMFDFDRVEVRKISATTLNVLFYKAGAFLCYWGHGFQNDSFRELELEYDTVAGTNAVTSINTGSFNGGPANLVNENLSIETIYNRAGFNTSKSGSDSAVAIAGAGGDVKWTKAELHDAMETHWSDYQASAQWAAYTLFAGKYTDSTVAGIMFDSSDANQRQGVAVFNDAMSHLNDRWKFFAAVHEIGHACNLYHAWSKTSGTNWTPQGNDSESRSFMNYPQYVAGGEPSFWSSFHYRFSDDELFFMRHAPEVYVKMGGSAFGTDHAFDTQSDQLGVGQIDPQDPGNVDPNPKLALDARVNRESPIFEFLEPVKLELKLTNTSANAVDIDKHALEASNKVTVIITRQGHNGRTWKPYARMCQNPETISLESGASIYETLSISSGLNGWDLAEPGVYDITVHLASGKDTDAWAIKSNSLRIRVARPYSLDEERIAQDYISGDVGRVLAFDGSRVLGKANDVLRDLAERLPEKRAALHAAIALGSPLANDFKSMQGGGKRAVEVAKANGAEARKLLGGVITGNADAAAETLGHIGYKQYADQLTDWLATQGDKGEAVKVQQTLHGALTKRNVKKAVLDSIAARQKKIGG